MCSHSSSSGTHQKQMKIEKQMCHTQPEHPYWGPRWINEDYLQSTKVSTSVGCEGCQGLLQVLATLHMVLYARLT